MLILVYVRVCTYIHTASNGIYYQWDDLLRLVWQVPAIFFFERKTNISGSRIIRQYLKKSYCHPHKRKMEGLVRKGIKSTLPGWKHNVFINRTIDRSDRSLYRPTVVYHIKIKNFTQSWHIYVYQL